MNFLTLVNEVLSELDVPAVTTLTGSTGMPKRTMSWVNRTIFDIYNRSNDWGFRESSGTFSTVAGTGTYSLPSTVDLDSLKTLFRQSDQVPLQYVDYENWDGLGGLSGLPGYYSVFQNLILLSPVPSQVTVIGFRYQLNPVNLANDSDLPVIPAKWHHVIVDGAAYRAKLFLGDDDFREQLARYEQGIKRMIHHNRDYLNRENGIRPESLE